MTQKPKTSKAPAGRRREADVLNAAIKVFYERGYVAATVQDIADELGILKGSLYHYIKTKEDLLFLVFESVHEDVDAILDRAIAEDELAPLERLYGYVREQVAYNVDHIAAMAVYYRDMDALAGERLAQVVASRKRHDKFVTDLIKAAQQRGQARADLVPRVVTPCIFAAIVWTYRWYRPSGALGKTEVAEQVARFAVGAVAVAEGVGEAAAA